MSDPILEEIWAVRRRIDDECGHDPDRLLERLRQVQHNHCGQVVQAPPAPQRSVTASHEDRDAGAGE